MAQRKKRKSGPLAGYDREFLNGRLEEMLLIRRFEEKCAQLYGLRKIGGFCHLCIGQEAVAVGSVAALDLAKDYVITAYRDHGHALACGMDLGAVMAELLGKITGSSRGKGGSMHLFDAEKHMLGGHAIVGGQIPLATGVALKIRYRQEDGLVMCFFGDGAIHQGVFHESLNLARIWDLPVIYVCENNQYGMGTDFRRVSAVDDFSVMGASYGITGSRVDAMDVLKVHEAVKAASSAVRDQQGPVFLEMLTYRYKGHSMTDPAKYRTREELEEYRQKDPILILRDQMLTAKLLSEDEFKAMDAAVNQRVNGAVEFAQSSAEPPLETMYEDVLA